MLEALTGLLLEADADRTLVAAALTHAWSVEWVALAIVLGTAAAALYAWHEHRRTSSSRALALFVLRGTLLASLGWLLCGPALKAEFDAARPGRVALLVDTSASMGLVDEAGRARHEPALAFADPQSGPLARHLSDERSALAVSLHGLADGDDDLADTSELAFAEGHTSLGPRLRALRQSAGAPISSVVLMSDGDFRLRPTDRQALRRMRAAGVPVHAVSVGPAGVGDDFEVASLTVPRRLVVGSVAAIDARVRRTGSMPGSATVRVEVDGIERQQVALEFGDAREQSVAFQLPLNEGGLRRIEVIVSPHAGEANTANNRDSALLYAEDRQLSVLHVEGEPRFEVKFIRRAVERDENLRILSLVRTAENKFYRLGIDTPDELKGGFPDTPEALFRYDGLILGSTPRDMLSAQQQQLIADFAARRGGGVLFLGGRFAFAEGGYEQGPVTRMLPFTLERNVPPRDAMLKLELTPEGRAHAIARMGAGARAVTPLAGLPALTSVNASVGDLSTLKPGASALWSGIAENRPGRRLALAEQRYGKGRVAAFAVRDIWRWQMHRELALDDQTHETFWRQWLRWLSRGARGHQHVTSDLRQVAPGEPVTLTVHTVNARYDPATGARHDLVVVTPGGERIKLNTEVGQHVGARVARFVARESGAHEVELVRRAGAKSEQAEDAVALTFFDVQALGREMYSPVRNDTVMRNIARLGGGQFVELANARSLFETIESNVTTVKQFDRIEIVEIPAVLAWFVILMSLEWLARRRWRLP